MTWWPLSHFFDNGQGPWSRPSGKRPSKADAEDILKKGREHFSKMMPKGGGSGGGTFVKGALVLLALWLASGFYQVKEGEKGAVLRFGKWVRTSTPGINYRFPYPVEAVTVVKVDKINRLDSEVALQRSSSLAGSEKLMLTGDENIVSVNFTVHWFINDVGKYLFSILDPNVAVRQAAESAVREIIAQTPISYAITSGRGEIREKVRGLLQKMLDQYDSGIQIQDFQLKSVDPPPQVVEAFRDVQRARANAESKINEAKAVYNSVVPVARGEAAKIVQAAKAYRQAVVDKASGEASRFLAILVAYEKAPSVTKYRMYLDTIQRVLGDKPKIVVDGRVAGGTGVLPYLPLSELINKTKQQGAN